MSVDVGSTALLLGGILAVILILLGAALAFGRRGR
jgi:hypothetical protein